jgi:hypothetical protein
VGLLNRLFGRKAVSAPPAGFGGGGGYAGGPSVDRFGKSRAPSAYELVRENLGTAYACGNLNSDLVAKTPRRLYVKRRNGEGRGFLSRRGDTKAVSCKSFERLTKTHAMALRDAAEVEEVTSHPALDLLDRPTGTVRTGVDGFGLVKLTQWYLEVVGRAYWWVECDGPFGRPSAIWVLASQFVSEQLGFGADDPIVTEYHYGVGRGRSRYTPDEVLPFRMLDLSTGGYVGGLSPLRAAYEQIKLARNADGLTNAQVENGGRPSAIVSPNGEAGEFLGPDEVARLTSRFKAMFAGAGAGGIVVGSNGLRVDTLNWPANDIIDAARYQMTRQQTADAFGVPITKLDRKDANRASAESGDYAHALDAGLPRLHAFDAALNDGLLPRYDDTGCLFFASDDPPGLEDRATEDKRWDTLVKAGSVKHNEVRARAGLEPTEEPWGEERTLAPAAKPTGDDGRGPGAGRDGGRADAADGDAEGGDREADQP